MARATRSWAPPWPPARTAPSTPQNRAIASPLLEDNSIQGAQGILINISGSASLTLHEVHEASSVIQKAAHENANIIFGAVQDDQMKDTIKSRSSPPASKDANKKQAQQRPSFLPKTWKAGRDFPSNQNCRRSHTRLTSFTRSRRMFAKSPAKFPRTTWMSRHFFVRHAQKA